MDMDYLENLSPGDAFYLHGSRYVFKNRGPVVIETVCEADGVTYYLDPKHIVEVDAVISMM